MFGLNRDMDAYPGWACPEALKGVSEPEVNATIWVGTH